MTFEATGAGGDSVADCVALETPKNNFINNVYLVHFL